ncbi:MAG: Hsp20/alpha crystallin family protein [Candidatus Omnitrophota bacterium]
MTLIPWREKEADRRGDVFNDDFFFGSFFPAMEKALVNNRGGWFPAMDVLEDKDQFIIKTDLPGLKKDDIRVSCENGLLTIEGERKPDIQTKERDWHKVERSYGRFVRSLNLGQVVDQARIKAQYKDGVLELSLPKTEIAKPKSIDIRVD